VIYFVLGTAAFSLFMFLLLLPRNLPSTTVRLSRRLDPLIALLFLAGFLLSIVFKSVVMLATTVLALWLFQRKRRELDVLRQRERLEAQFVDFLGILSSLYAATGDLVGSMDRAADGVGDPLAKGNQSDGARVPRHEPPARSLAEPCGAYASVERALFC
jgi:hypothetical protein